MSSPQWVLGLLWGVENAHDVFISQSSRWWSSHNFTKLRSSCSPSRVFTPFELSVKCRQLSAVNNRISAMGQYWWLATDSRIEGPGLSSPSVFDDCSSVVTPACLKNPVDSLLDWCQSWAVLFPDYQTTYLCGCKAVRMQSCSKDNYSLCLQPSRSKSPCVEVTPLTASLFEGGVLIMCLNWTRWVCQM